MEQKKIKIYLILILILAFGFFLRVYNINNAPPGVYPDEAVNGQDALRTLDTGNFQWFYPDNQGREGLMMNLVALCFKLFGVSVLTLKLPAIVFGTLTILGVFLLTKELFKNNRIGLISAFLTAFSFIAINFNRISFRANLLPFVLVFTFYFLFRGINTKKIYNYAIGGFIFGIGVHTYIAFRIAPLILFALLVSFLLSRRHFLKEYWKPIVVFIVFSFISAAPMIYTLFVSHPEYMESRSSSISILSPQVNQGHLLQTFFRSFGLSLIKYNFWGDQNWKHNYPPYPILDPITGMAFLFGFLYSFFNLFKYLYLRFVKKHRAVELDKYTLLISWFFAMLVPEFMTAEGNPHALRSIGTLPVVFIFSAMTFEHFFKKAENSGIFFKKFTTFFLVFILIFIGLFNSVKYHYFWANKLETALSFENVLMDISRYIRNIPPQKEVFAVLGNMQRVPVRIFSWGRPGFHDLHPAEIDKINPPRSESFEVIFTDLEKEMIIKNLKQKFPNLNLYEYKDRFGTNYYVLK